MKGNVMKRYVWVTILLILLAAGCSKSVDTSKVQAPVAVQAPVEFTKVRFANLPYGDHTYSIIGVEKGFFRDVGIDLTADTIKIDDVVASLVNGSYDVASVPPGILFSSYETAPELRTFVFGDLFQGYALMARGDAGFKKFSDFRSQGLSQEAALAATVAQLKGHTFAYPTETAIKPFIDLLLKKGGVSRKQFKALVLDDPLTVNAMRQGQAQFQVGGVPSRITLQKEGFIPLISSADLARGAKASPESPELASILQNGWATTKTFYDQHKPTLLRLASVNYRIMKFMETNRQDAIRIHMAYLSRVTGAEFTAKDGAIIYDDLDPFVTFEGQKSWFHDSSAPLYYANVNGAILQSFKSDGIYRKRAPTVEDIIFADDVYRELEQMKADASRDFEEVKPKEQGLSPELASKLKESRSQFEHYNYYDAARLAREVRSAVIPAAGSSAK